MRTLPILIPILALAFLVSPVSVRAQDAFFAVVRGIDAFWSRMQDLGVDTDDSIFVDSALQVRSFVMRDLEGNRLQIFERCTEECR